MVILLILCGVVLRYLFVKKYYSAISLAERRRWYFVMATIFVRLDTLMMWSREQEKSRLTGFNRAVNLLKEVAKSDLLYHKVLASAYLGKFYFLHSCQKRPSVSDHDYIFSSLVFVRKEKKIKKR